MFNSMREFFTTVLAEFKRHNDLYERDINTRGKSWEQDSPEAGKFFRGGTFHTGEPPAKVNAIDKIKDDIRRTWNAQIRVSPVRESQFNQRSVALSMPPVDYIRRNTVGLASKVAAKVAESAAHIKGSDRCHQCVEELNALRPQLAGSDPVSLPDHAAHGVKAAKEFDAAVYDHLIVDPAHDFQVAAACDNSGPFKS